MQPMERTEQYGFVSDRIPASPACVQLEASSHMTPLACTATAVAHTWQWPTWRWPAFGRRSGDDLATIRRRPDHRPIMSHTNTRALNEFVTRRLHRATVPFWLTPGACARATWRDRPCRFVLASHGCACAQTHIDTRLVGCTTIPRYRLHGERPFCTELYSM